jgi:hypothetical protein
MYCNTNSSPWEVLIGTSDMSLLAGGFDEAGVSARAQRPGVMCDGVANREVLGQRPSRAHGVLLAHHHLGLRRPQAHPQTHPSQGKIRFHSCHSKDEDFHKTSKWGFRMAVISGEDSRAGFLFRRGVARLIRRYR